MSDDVLAQFLEGRACGAIQRRVRLRGSIAVSDGTDAPVFLCQTTRGVYVAAANTPTAGALMDLSDVHPLGYVNRLIGDRLVVGALGFTIPYGRSTEARLAISVGRLLARQETTTGPPPSGPFIQSFSEPELAWVRTRLAPDEALIAWLLTATRAELSQPLRDGSSADWRLVITSERALLVAISELGDLREAPLPDAAITLKEGTGRVELSAGDHHFASPLGRDRPFRLVAGLPGLPRAQRLREAARLGRILRTPEGWAAAGRLLSSLGETQQPIDALALALLETEEKDARLEEAVALLVVSEPDSAALADHVERWELSLEEAEQVLALVLSATSDPDQAPWGLPLHRTVHQRRRAEHRSLLHQAEADLALSEHLLVAGRHDEALAILEARLQALPDEDLVEVLPPEGADLTRGAGGQPAHIRVLELLVLARGGPEKADVSALAALARHQPLVPRRLSELALQAEGDLATRARRALALHEADRSAAQRPPAPRVRSSLSAPQVELLRHPVERSGGALGRIQAALAKVVPPDLSEVRSYCARASTRSHPELIAVLADASLMLGMPAVPAYISQGDRRVGVRSFEEPEPFVLIGGAHLDPDDDAFLDPLELRFAVGAEVAHLRLGHSRVTSAEVWAGLWDKTGTAVGITASLLPFIKFLPVDLIGRERTATAVQAIVPSSWLTRIYGADQAAQLSQSAASDLGRLGKASASALGTATGAMSGADKLRDTMTPERRLEDLGTDARRLVAAHRVMQITADRAGLMLCSDLDAAVSAIFKTHSQLRGELSLVLRAGLSPALGRLDDQGRPLFPHLSVRLAALTAFWLSDDHARLAQALAAGEE